MVNMDNKMNTSGEDYSLFTAYSNIDGSIIGGMWILSFLCFVGEFQMPLLSFVAIALAIASVGVLVGRMKKFRDKVLYGRISFGRALLYSVQTCFEATLLMAVAQCVYFQFLDHGYLINQYVTMLSTPEYAAIVKESYGLDAKQLIAILQSTMGEVRPVEIAFQFLTVNVVVSLILSLPVAAVVRKV